MRISDWSSDVCSSDLLDAFGGPGLTLIILVVTGNDLHQGGLARTVDADDGDLRARQELQVNIVENGLVRAREGLGQTLHDKAILHGHFKRSLHDPIIDRKSTRLNSSH